MDKLDGSTAIFSYDRSGNLVEGDGRRIDFDLMDRPVRACSGTPAECAPGASAVVPVTEFSYAPDGGRYRQRVTGSASAGFGPKTVYYLDKDYELTVWADGTMEDRSYLGPTAVVYRKTQGTTTTREVRYQHLDRLGSVDAVTRDDATATLVSVDVHGFDPWGKPRGETWTSSGARLHPGGDQPSQAVTTDRGFTGHEHLDVHYLIHMNGRVYDYRLGRFLSVDPIIGDPANPQAVNPYSYIGNNPLSGTDPSGYMADLTSGGSPLEIIWVNPAERQYRLTDGGKIVAQGTLSQVAPTLQSWLSGGGNNQGSTLPNTNAATHGSPQDAGRPNLVSPGDGAATRQGTTLGDGAAGGARVVRPLSERRARDDAIGTVKDPNASLGKKVLAWLMIISAQTAPIGPNVITAGNAAAKAPSAIRVTEEGLTRIEAHLAKLGALKDEANAAMLARLRSGQTASQDINFYVHELRESALMARSGGYGSFEAWRAAHLETLRFQDIRYVPGYESQLYHPDVIVKFKELFNPAAWPK